MTGTEYYIQCHSRHELIVQAGMNLMSREYLRQTGMRFPVGIYHEDKLFSALTMTSAQRVSHTSRSVYRRRIREGSIVTTATEFRHAFGYFFAGQELRRWTQTHTDIPEVTRQLLQAEAHDGYQQAIKRMLEIKEKPQLEYYLALPDACDFYALVYAPFEAKKREQERERADKTVSRSFESYRNTVHHWKVGGSSDGSAVKKKAKQILPASYQKIDQQSYALLALQQRQTQLLLKAMEPDQERSQQMQAQLNQLMEQVQRISDELTCMRLSD